MQSPSGTAGLSYGHRGATKPQPLLLKVALELVGTRFASPRLCPGPRPAAGYQLFNDRYS
ncbi:hypothetical protein [Streptomyces lunalinharesii]|uniref:Uncharacterized protein n=1 Tax=Streptomyces lunalinharesii TaxID=333384 RepID=A0ABN3RPM0_9ACTN